MTPSIQLSASHAGFQQCIPLLERPCVPPPQVKEAAFMSLFHVEQAPIHESAARFAAASNQSVAAGFEADDRQGGTKIPQLGHVLTIQSTGPRLARVPETRPPDPRMRGFMPLDEDFQRFGLRPNQAIPHTPTKAAAVRHQVQCLQQTGFTGAVVARNQVQSFFGRKRHMIETPQPACLQSGYLHDDQLAQDDWSEAHPGYSDGKEEVNSNDMGKILVREASATV